MPSSRPRVLIVDDQAANIDVLAEALSRDYELFAATSAERALEIANGGVDLILLDVMMPDQDGFELCRILKAGEKTRSVPVIFVTALGEVEDEARGFEVGGVDYIAKPISPPTVRARVRTHIDLRGALKRLEQEAEVLAENLRLKEHVERLSRHDLKTPLTSVISIPQMLLETSGLTDEQKRLLRAIEGAGYRILDMVNRSLDLFRMESGVYEFQPARVDAREVVERVCDDLASLARERGVTIAIPDRTAAAPPEGLVMAEELLTYSMLANLIKNAVEAAPVNTVVQVFLDAGPAGSHDVAISVQNQGTVPLFLRDAFFRKYSSSGKKSGTGLGTYSARLMAETQGGRIEMRSDDERGTTVTVTLQAATATDQTADPRPVPALGSREPTIAGLRVLVVDDDESTRFVLERFLEGALAIASVGEGEEALIRIDDFSPDVIVLDAEMPGLDGFVIAKRIREREASRCEPRRRLIGLSSHDDSESNRTFLKAGCDAVLVKPVPKATLLAAVGKEPARTAPASPAPGAAAFGVVVVSADLISLIPAFLESRRELATALEAALVARDLELVRGLAHKLRGGLAMCGFVEAGEMSRVIEQGAAAGEGFPELLAHIARLRAYLQTVQFTYAGSSDRRLIR